jgi:TetR/AcrR family transcriptional regulator, tetracycline repressor protein
MAMYPLLRSAMDILDEAGPDAAFDHGLAVILDGLEKIPATEE